MNTPSEYLELISSHGISLRCLGLTEMALCRADAMRAVELLRKTSVPILGGDVYFRKVTGIELAYANWHSDPLDGEDGEAFVKRSCRETEHYIEKFPTTDEEPIFVLVLDV